MLSILIVELKFRYLIRILLFIISLLLHYESYVNVTATSYVRPICTSFGSNNHSSVWPIEIENHISCKVFHYQKLNSNLVLASPDAVTKF